MPYQFLADAVLGIHLAVVVFIVGGLAAIVVGGLRGWQWIADVRFRIAHLGAIAIVTALEWLGQGCPLTTLESWLRTRAGGTGYDRGLIADWVRSILFYEAPGWAFALVYTAFGLVVLAAWWRFPPRGRHNDGRSAI